MVVYARRLSAYMARTSCPCTAPRGPVSVGRATVNRAVTTSRPRKVRTRRCALAVDANVISVVEAIGLLESEATARRGPVARCRSRARGSWNPASGARHADVQTGAFGRLRSFAAAAAGTARARSPRGTVRGHLRRQLPHRISKRSGRGPSRAGQGSRRRRTPWAVLCRHCDGPVGELVTREAVARGRSRFWRGAGPVGPVGWVPASVSARYSVGPASPQSAVVSEPMTRVTLA